MTVAPPKPVPVTKAGDRIVAHGTAVAFDGRAVLMIGPSGCGKSALALELMAHGAILIGDDRVDVRTQRDAPVLAPPPQTAGRIEARFVGILTADFTSAPLALVVDMASEETDRLPPLRRAILRGTRCRFFKKLRAAISSRRFCSSSRVRGAP